MPFNPFYFFNSPLAMEKLEKLLVEYKNQQMSIDELTKEVAAIGNVVAEQLQQMYNDGTLKTLLEQIVDEHIPTPPMTTNIDLSHIGRVFHISHRYGQAPRGDVIDTTYDTERYSFAQGNTVAVINGVRYWIVAYVCQNASHFTTNNGGAIYVYKFVNDNQLEYVSRVFVSAVGHMNSLTYNNGYVYIAPNSYAGEGGGLTTDIIRYAMSDSGIIDVSSKEVKTADVYASGSAKFTDHICAYNGVLYFTDGEMNIYQYDWDTNTATLLYNRILDGNDITYSGDGMTINDDYIYVGHGGDRRIYRFNRQSQKVDVCYQYPMVCNNQMYKCGEVQGITLIDDVMYVLGSYNLGANLYTNDYNVTRFYCQNIKTNGIPATNTFGGWTSGITNIATLYVNGSIPLDTDNPSNPTGHTEGSAFQSVQEALDYVESSKWIKRGNIIVLQPINQSSIYVKTTKPVTISGGVYKSRNDKSYAIVGYIYSIGGNIQLDSLCVRAIFPDDVYTATGINSAIQFDKNIADCYDLYIPVGLNSNPAQIKYAYSSIRGLLNVHNPYTTESYWESRGDNYKICNTFNTTVNSHGNFTKNSNIIN